MASQNPCGASAARGGRATYPANVEPSSLAGTGHGADRPGGEPPEEFRAALEALARVTARPEILLEPIPDRKSTRLNSSHANISYAVFCLKKKKHIKHSTYTD